MSHKKIIMFVWVSLKPRKYMPSFTSKKWILFYNKNKLSNTRKIYL